MLKITLDTGVFYAKSFFVDGNIYDDILGLIDDYVQKNKKEFRIYTLEECIEIYEIEDMYNFFAPINGGEYFIDNISNVEEVN